LKTLTVKSSDRKLIADHSGALVCPEEDLLIVADLHLEKGSFFAAFGSAIPPYDSREAIDRLGKVLDRWSPKRVISLGDSFHDASGYHRLSIADQESIKSFTSTYDWIWISGNHDPEPPEGLGGTSSEAVDIKGLTFRHEPSNGQAMGEVAGHLHPKASIKAMGKRVSRPCFIADDCRVILPAFGCYTGGLNVLDPAFITLFPKDYRAYLLGQDQVHVVARRQIERCDS
jgi:DNA ligase-associated metallophosphoesterase